MPRLLRDRRAGALVVTAALVTMTACVHQGAAKVAVDKMQASLVFGVKPPTPPGAAASPPAINPPDTSGGDATPVDQLVAFKKKPLTVPSTVKVACAEAPDGASADRALSVSATNLPTEGFYQFKDTGYTTISAGGQTFKQPLGGFDHRAIAHVHQSSPALFTYDFLETNSTRNIDVYHMQVKNNGAQVNPSSGVGTVGTPREGEPERGVVIKGIEHRDPASGNTPANTSPFTPSTGLLLLPLPVSSGEGFQSVAVDQVHNHSIVLQGTVQAAYRVDACGQLIDGWLVNATWHETIGGIDYSYDYHYAISPQYGGIIIHEEWDYPAATNPPVDKLIYDIGQVTPDPLPAGF